MEQSIRTDALRVSAAEWSLAGDRKLLELLQNLHQKIISKCQETNNRLDVMVAALDDASVSLQNVNNRFMALSNSQFIESRVYDDDTDVNSEDTTNKNASSAISTASVQSELTSLVESLRTLERAHEPVTLTIGTSDSESDSEDDQQSVILRPKDLYADRPLPYIIGSQNWKSKWHAGLIIEDSDSDSAGSKQDDKHEEYSDSETETGGKQAEWAPPAGRYEDSMASSETSSHREVVVEAKSKPTQADIAAELARRLGGIVEKPEPKPHTQAVTAKPVSKTVYKPQQPAPGALFLDEPPPLDNTQESDSDYNDESDDIFAEINRQAPYADKNKAQNQTREVTDIFADLNKGQSKHDFIDEIKTKIAEKENGFHGKKSNVESNSNPDLDKIKKKSPLFDDELSDPIVEEAQNPSGTESDKTEKVSKIKKPAGAISLFGSNQGTAIGAAILNRSRRKSSSDEESSTKDEIITEEVKHDSSNIKEMVEPKEKDIFEDLFARSAKNQKTPKSNIQDTDKKVDLFSDDIFDDIDDIFSSSVLTKPAKDVKKYDDKVKSLFDDVDDLFADIGVEKNIKIVTKTEKVLENDDELFSNKSGKFNINNKTTDQLNQLTTSKLTTHSYSLNTKNDNSKSTFNNDDDLFIDKNNKNLKTKSDKEEQSVEERVKYKGIFDSDDELCSTSKHPFKKHNTKDPFVNSTVKSAPKSLFGDDDEDTDSDIFSKIKSPVVRETKNTAELLYQNDLSSFKNQQDTTNDNTTQKKDTEKHNELGWRNNNALNIEEKPLEVEAFQNSSLKSTTDVKIINTKLMNSPNLFDDALSEGFLSDTELPKNKCDKDIFTPEVIKSETVTQNQKTVLTSKNKETDSKEDIVSSDTVNINVNNNINRPNYFKSPKIFDSDDDDDFKGNLFVKTHQNDSTSTNKINKHTIEDKSNNDNNVSSKDVTNIKTDTNDILDNSQTYFDTNKNVNKDDVPPNTVEQKSYDEFDIFTSLPPAFEKPKEPKKSKNVNALFDDDSDDEALFLRKSDIITDEKPEDFVPKSIEKVFTIFDDQPPPAVDIDFTKNSSELSKPVVDVPTSIKEYVIEDSKCVKNEETVIADNIDGVSPSKNENLPKSIGKLKSMNFNINVNTLLPGASPKKVIKTRNEDASSVRSEEINESESKLVKSVSFDGSPDSPVLNNKFSKERAKIQVKRRPSTRRARQEAARKSAIDYNVDNIDGIETVFNASDKIPSNLEIATKTESSKEVLENPNEISSTSQKLGTEYNKTQILNINDDDIYIFREPNFITRNNEIPSQKVNNSEPDLGSSGGITTLGKVYTEMLETPCNDNIKSDSSKPNVTDDDDDNKLFKSLEIKSSKPDSSKSNEIVKSDSLKVNVIDDDDDQLFESIEIKSSKPKLSKDVSKESTKSTKIPIKSTAKSLFDDLSDDEDLFGGNKSRTAKSESKLDPKRNDSDDETLFSRNIASKTSSLNKNVNVTKKSLFDDDDNDDLFVKKANTSQETTSQSKPVHLKETITEPVFEDPLSLLGNTNEN